MIQHFNHTSNNIDFVTFFTTIKQNITTWLGQEMYLGKRFCFVERVDKITINSKQTLYMRSVRHL